MQPGLMTLIAMVNCACVLDEIEVNYEKFAEEKSSP